MPDLIKGYAPTGLGQIHYCRGGRGRPVVLLPHSGRSSRMYANLIRALSPHYEVFAFDLPGSGESVALRNGISFEDIASALVEAMQSLHLHAVDLYGIHTGNKIGANIAAGSSGLIRSFVFAGQTHSLIPDQTARNQAIRAVAAAALAAKNDRNSGPLTDWVARIGELQSYCLSRATLDDILATQDMSPHLDWLVDEVQGFIGRRPLYEANFRYDLERDLRRIAVPTLILEIATPDEDRRLGRQGAIVQCLIPGSRLETLVETGGIGHTMDHRAAEVARILTGFFNQ